MPRVVSFIVLVAILLMVGSMFFKVMLQFVVPLFLAAVLVVVFNPLHEWMLKKLGGRPRIAALATTAAIMVTVLGPTAWLGLNSYRECSSELGFLIPDEHEPAEDKQRRERLIETVENRAEVVLQWYHDAFNKPLDYESLFEQASSWGFGTVTSTFHVVLGLLMGLAIMTLALYYFLLDGNAMIETLMRLSPLDDEYERELLDKFASVSRAVVVASLLSAVAQGLLAGIGYYFCLRPGAPVFLLTAATMALAIVPFIGGAAIWVPTCLWIYFIDDRSVVTDSFLDNRTTAATVLAIYCTLVVSSVDNFIKPYVLHGQTNLHPLLALLSVLGGVQVVGPIGILVGPMLVAFIQALLNMLNQELQRMSNSTAEDKLTAGLSPAVVLQAEAAVPQHTGDLFDDRPARSQTHEPMSEESASEEPSAQESDESDEQPDAQ